MITSQERLLAIIPENYLQIVDSWQGFDLWVKAKGVLAINWGVRSGRADTVGCLPNSHSSSLPIEPSVWYVSGARGGYDWSKPNMAISFPYAGRQVTLFQPAGLSDYHWRLLGNSALLKEHSIRKSRCFHPAFFLPALLDSTWGCESHLQFQQPSCVCAGAHSQTLRQQRRETEVPGSSLTKHRASSARLVSPISRLLVMRERVSLLFKPHILLFADTIGLQF